MLSNEVSHEAYSKSRPLSESQSFHLPNLAKKPTDTEGTGGKSIGHDQRRQSVNREPRTSTRLRQIVKLEELSCKD